MRAVDAAASGASSSPPKQSETPADTMSAKTRCFGGVDALPNRRAACKNSYPRRSEVEDSCFHAEAMLFGIGVGGCLGSAGMGLLAGQLAHRGLGGGCRGVNLGSTRPSHVLYFGASRLPPASLYAQSHTRKGGVRAG